MLTFFLVELAVRAAAKDFPGVMGLGGSFSSIPDLLFWFSFKGRDLLDFRMQMWHLSQSADAHVNCVCFIGLFSFVTLDGNGGK